MPPTVRLGPHIIDAGELIVREEHCNSEEKLVLDMIAPQACCASASNLVWKRNIDDPIRKTLARMCSSIITQANKGEPHNSKGRLNTKKLRATLFFVKDTKAVLKRKRVLKGQTIAFGGLRDIVHDLYREMNRQSKNNLDPDSSIDLQAIKQDNLYIKDVHQQLLKVSNIEVQKNCYDGPSFLLKHKTEDTPIAKESNTEPIECTYIKPINKVVYMGDSYTEKLQYSTNCSMAQISETTSTNGIEPVDFSSYLSAERLQKLFNRSDTNLTRGKSPAVKGDFASWRYLPKREKHPIFNESGKGFK